MKYNATVTATVRRHLEAVTKMLLADKMMKRGLSIIAAGPLSGAGTADLAIMAKQSQTDVICLQFDIAGSEAVMTDIAIVAPRDTGCYVYTGCRLTQRAGETRARLLPRAGGPGHFDILPGEIVHRRNCPPDLVEGVARANVELTKLVAKGVDVWGQVVIENFTAA